MFKLGWELELNGTFLCVNLSLSYLYPLRTKASGSINSICARTRDSKLIHCLVLRKKPNLYFLKVQADVLWARPELNFLLWILFYRTLKTFYFRTRFRIFILLFFKLIFWILASWRTVLNLILNLLNKQ